MYDLTSILERLASRSIPPVPGARASGDAEAAVAAILREPAPGEEVEILLMRRAEREGDPWSGHMAFPGGRRDPEDADLLATAVRETREEVGLDLDAHGKLLGALDPVPAIARGRRIGLTISPFVFALATREPPPLVPNDEVAELLWWPLGALGRGETRGTFPYTHEGVVMHLPCLHVGDRVVWGLTYQMLQAFFETLSGAPRR